MFFTQYVVATYYIVKCAFFFSLLRAAIRSEPLMERPVLLAVLYTAGIAFLSWAYGFLGPDRQRWLISTFILSTVYFWLLNRFEDAGFPWWVLMIAGGAGLIYY